MSFFAELKRRNVFRIAIGYVVIAWLMIQVADVILNNVSAPDWVFHTLLLFIAIGFPFAVFFAWAFELTPEGLKRDRDVHRSQPITTNTIKKLKDSKTAATQLNSIYYKSRCTSMADLDLVNSILVSSTKNNSANNVTGVLIATKTHFLQILEGEFEMLNDTFERISRDTRHEKIQLISFAQIEERRFGEWAMHGVGLFDLNSQLAIELCKKFGEENGNVQIPSTAREVTEFLDML